MNRWEKLSQFCLRIVQELRVQRAASMHVATALSTLTSDYGRSLDALGRIEAKLDETLASHAQANRQITAQSGDHARLARRVADLEGGASNAP